MRLLIVIGVIWLNGFLVWLSMKLIGSSRPVITNIGRLLAALFLLATVYGFYGSVSALRSGFDWFFAVLALQNFIFMVLLGGYWWFWVRDRYKEAKRWVQKP